VAVALPRRRRPGTTAAARRPGTADVLASATFSGPSGAGLVGGHRRLDAGLRDARRGRVAAVGIGEVRRLGERAGVDGDAGGVEHLLGALERIEPVGDRPHRRLAPLGPDRVAGSWRRATSSSTFCRAASWPELWSAAGPSTS